MYYVFTWQNLTVGIFCLDDQIVLHKETHIKLSIFLKYIVVIKI